LRVTCNVDKDVNVMRTLPFFAAAIIFLVAVRCIAQSDPDHSAEFSRMQQQLADTQTQLQESRQQIDQLRKDLEDLRSQVQAKQNSVDETSPNGEPTTAKADESADFLAAKVAELHQDKVESASKYPVKLSGLVLFNSYWNNGSLDIADLPNLAFPKFPGAPDGDLGATLRQSILGIDVTGPKVFGAQSSAGVSMDFAGGSPTTSYGVTAGLLRLRTGQVRLDWENTSINIGQDTPFISPLSPTSYATLLEPALAWSGNLWVWTPQIEVEHRLALNADSKLVLQGGLLDPLTEMTPPFQGRVATEGEATRVPAIAGRLALDRSHANSHPFEIGVGVYRARQKYRDFSGITSWTVNTDLRVPLGNRFELSGELYDGQAVGGLGGGIWTSVIYSSPDPETAPAIHPLRSIGAWAQLKVRPISHIEINGAFGQDENFGHSLRFFPIAYSEYGSSPFQKNQTSFVNVIYKPNSFLIFATEYRHLFTAPTVGDSGSVDHLNLAAGVQF
jgi:cell division protein FtsB